MRLRVSLEGNPAICILYQPFTLTTQPIMLCANQSTTTYTNIYLANTFALNIIITTCIFTNQKYILIQWWKQSYCGCLWQLELGTKGVTVGQLDLHVYSCVSDCLMVFHSRTSLLFYFRCYFSLFGIHYVIRGSDIFWHCWSNVWLSSNNITLCTVCNKLFNKCYLNVFPKK